MSTHIHEMHNDVSEVLFSEEQLKTRVAELGAEIARDYADKDRVLLVSVLRGSYIFMADLSRAIDIPVEIDFMSVSSYGKGTKSSGQVEIKKDLSDSIEGVHVIVVEDILDSGNTLSYLLHVLEARHPASIKLCTRKSIEGQSGVLLDELFPVGFIAKRRPTSYYCQACRTLLTRLEP